MHRRLAKLAAASLWFLSQSAFPADPLDGGTLAGKVTARGVDASQACVVYVEGNSLKATPASQNPAIAQENKRFNPLLAVVVSGTTVDFPNRDKVFHNAFSITSGQEFDLGLYRSGESQSHQFRKPGAVDIYCNIHPEMATTVLVVPNDFYARVGADGTYRIEGLPAGEHTVQCFALGGAQLKKTVAIKAGAVATLDFDAGKVSAAKVHTKKDGSAYGRYK